MFSPNVKYRVLVIEPWTFCHCLRSIVLGVRSGRHRRGIGGLLIGLRVARSGWNCLDLVSSSQRARRGWHCNSWKKRARADMGNGKCHSLDGVL